MQPSTKSVRAFDVIREELPKWWADKGTKDLREGVGYVVPTDAADLGLMMLGGPGGRAVKKAGAALLGAGATGEAQAGSLVPLMLTKMKKHVPEILAALRGGADRAALYEKYGIVATGNTPGDLAIHLPNKPGSVRDIGRAFEAIPLEEVYSAPELYKMAPDMRRLNVVQAPNGPSGVGAYYSEQTPRWTLPQSLDMEVSKPGLEAIVGHIPLSTKQDLMNNLGVVSRAPGTILEHEVNHALGGRGQASAAKEGLPWSSRIEEIVASLGAQDIPTAELVAQYEKILPALSSKTDYVRQARPAVGKPETQEGARRFFNTWLPSERKDRIDAISARNYAKGGIVDKSKSSDPYANQRGLSQLAKKYPSLHGFLGALIGTAPDEFESGSVLDPEAVERKKAVQLGAKYGFPLGTALQFIPGGGGFAKGVATTASPVSGGRLAQRGVIKMKGGNWLTGSAENALSRLKRGAHYGPGPAEILPGSQTEALNNWVDKQLTRYIKNEMATPEDPIRALAERGVSHATIRPSSYSVSKPREYAGFPKEGLGVSPEAKAWESISDSSIYSPAAGDLTYDKELLVRDPWLLKVPPDTPAHQAVGGVEDLGFPHLMDELRNATNPDSGLPPELLLKYSSLPQVSVPQAVERVAKINEWRAAQKVAADQARANNAATVLHKDYPDKGFKWVELKAPGLPEGWIDEVDALGVPVARGPGGYSTGKGSIKDPRRSTLEDALKYEGDTMGHCVGGYCPDVLEGRSRIFSLRSAKGEPHVTIEVEPGIDPKPGHLPWDQIPEATRTNMASRGLEPTPKMMREGFLYDPETGKASLSFSPSIKQIKGKANRKPNDEYLPFVQDFVKSGQWSDVGDIQNSGLRRTADAFNDLERQKIRNAGVELGDYYTPEEISDIGSRVWPLPEGFANGGVVQGYNHEMINQRAANLARELGL